MLTHPLWLRDLAAASFQAAALMIAGGMLPSVLRLRAPRVRLVYWQLLLAACLVLPFVEPWRAKVVAEGTAQVAFSFSQDAARSVVPATRPFPWAELILAVLLAGIVVRLSWTCLGLARLRVYCKRSRPLDGATDSVYEAQGLVAVTARLYVSRELASPATFGLISPAVILPERFLALSPSQQRAIACHELLHVRRRDWVWNLAEEVVLSLLWFHPAIWWLIRNIRLSREQAVDAEAVCLTQARKDYLEALLEIARQSQNARLAPAALFLLESQLAARVALLVKEVTMSKRKLIAVSVVSAAVLIVTGGLAVWAFPLRSALTAEIAQDTTSPGPGIPGGVEGGISGGVKQGVQGGVNGGVQGGVSQGVETERQVGREAAGGRSVPARARSGASQASPALKIIHSVTPVYPPLAMMAGIQGNVVFDVTVDAKGTVTSAEVVSGHPLLVQAALDAVKQWKFAPRANPPVTTTVTVSFQRPRVVIHSGENTGSEPAGAQAAASRGGDNITEASSDLRLIHSVTPVYPPLARMARIQSAVVLDVTVDADGNVTDAKVVSGHPLLIQSALDAVRQFKFAPPANPPATTTITIDFRLPSEQDPPPAGPTVRGPMPQNAAKSASDSGRTYSYHGEEYRYGGAISGVQIVEPSAIYAPDPPYTKQARDAKVQGDVVLLIAVGKDGRVEGVKEVSKPLGKGLDESAIKTVRTWKFKPKTSDGKPVPAKMRVDVAFRLLG